MLKRIWHALIVGHSWGVERVVRISGTGKLPWGGFLGNGLSESRWREVHGRTDINERCECGATRTRTLTGAIQDQKEGGDSEVEQLRKMAGLK